MALERDGESSSNRIFMAVLAVIGGLLIGMAVGFLVDPDTKKAAIARLL